MTVKYTLNELLIIVAAREIHDDENVILGVGLPTISGALAKALHAPNANLMMESGIVDFEPLVRPNHIADAMCCRGFSWSTDLFTSFTNTYRGFVDVCFLGVAQVDKFGNLNTTVVGDYFKPEMRLPGSGGAPDFISYAKRTVLTLRKGDFVEKLDYFTSPGYLEGGSSRDDSGFYPQGTGPTMLISQKGIFRFDPESKEMYLAHVHPGIKVEDVRKDVPWDLKVDENLSVTEPPNEAEIAFIRRFAPTESAGGALLGELSLANIMKKIEARQKP